MLVYFSGDWDVGVGAPPMLVGILVVGLVDVRRGCGIFGGGFADSPRVTGTGIVTVSQPCLSGIHPCSREM